MLRAAGGGSASRRTRQFVALCLVAVAAAALSVMAAQFVRSPAQIAADTAAPARTVLTAPVERRVLSRSVALAGRVENERTYQVRPAAPTTGERAVVSAIRVSKGAEVTAGQVLLEVGGRPLVLLRGEVPAYRDLRPGSQGRDVEQLQQALRDLGYPTGSDRPGVLERGTKGALTKFYQALGYAIQTVGERELDGARSAVVGATRAVEEATDALRALTSATTSAPDPATLRSAQRAVRYAKEDLARARATYAEADVAAGPMLPAAEVLFVPTLPARVQDVTAKVGTEASGVALTLSGGGLVVRGVVNDADQALVRVDQEVRLVTEGGSGEIAARVGSISPERQEVDPQAPEVQPGYPITVLPAKPLPAELVGQMVRVVVTVARTDAEVLVVPVAAVSVTGDGRTTVSTVGTGGEQSVVEVFTGFTGDGYVEVRPMRGALSPGDQVVVGT